MWPTDQWGPQGRDPRSEVHYDVVLQVADALPEGFDGGESARKAARRQIAPLFERVLAPHGPSLGSARRPAPPAPAPGHRDAAPVRTATSSAPRRPAARPRPRPGRSGQRRPTGPETHRVGRSSRPGRRVPARSRPTPPPAASGTYTRHRPSACAATSRLRTVGTTPPVPVENFSSTPPATARRPGAVPTPGAPPQTPRGTPGRPPDATTTPQTDSLTALAARSLQPFRPPTESNSATATPRTTATRRRRDAESTTPRPDTAATAATCRSLDRRPETTATNALVRRCKRCRGCDLDRCL